MKHLPAALSALLLLSACTQDVPPTPPALHFTQSAPFRVTVAQIRVDQQYQPPLAAPNVEHQFPTSPASAVQIWTNDRLQASGTAGQMTVTVTDASVREVPLPKETGLNSWVTNDQARYDAKLAVTFRLYDGTNNLALAVAQVSVTRARSLKRNATQDERTAFYANLTNDIMQDFDTQATAQLRQYFAAYLQ